MNTIDLQPNIPLQATYQRPLSFEGQIVRKTQNQIQASSLIDYDYDSARIIRFYIASAECAAEFQNCEVEMTVKTQGLYDGTNKDIRRFLPIGGVHALFKRMEIRSRDDTQFRRINNYNEQVALKTILYESAQIADHVNMLHANSMGVMPYNHNELGLDGYSYKLKGDINTGANGGVQNLTTLTYSAVTSTAATQTLTLTGGAATSELNAGDWIVVSSSTPDAEVMVLVTSVTNDTTVIVQGLNPADISVAGTARRVDPAYCVMANHNLDEELAPGDRVLFRDANLIPKHVAVVTEVDNANNYFKFSPPPLVGAINDNMYVYRQPLALRNRLCRPEESAAIASANGIKVRFKPMLELFNLEQYFPLWLTNGLILEMELEDPNYAVVLSKNFALSENASVNYRISNAKFICDFVQYNDDIRHAWEQQWRSEEGILIHQNEWVHHRNDSNNGSNASFSLSIDTEGVSVRSVFGYCRGQRAVTINKTASLITNTQTYDPYGVYSDAKLQSFQYRQGSQLFPQQRVDLNDSNSIDIPMAEVWSSLRAAMRSMGMALLPKIPFGAWLKENVGDDTSTAFSADAGAHSNKCIFAADLSFYPGPFGGLYTRNNRTMYFDAETHDSFDLNGAAQNRYFSFFVVRDEIIQIQKDKGITRVS